MAFLKKLFSKEKTVVDEIVSTTQLLENELKHVVHGGKSVFNANTLSYIQSAKTLEEEIKGIAFQLCLFDWLSWPDAGELGCPFKAGIFFSINMTSGKTGVWLCLSEVHDRSKESGQLLAIFCGYLGKQHFYDKEDFSIILDYLFSKVLKSKEWKFRFDTTVNRSDLL